MDFNDTPEEAKFRAEARAYLVFMVAESLYRAGKPAEAVDACWIGGQKITDMSVVTPARRRPTP